MISLGWLHFHSNTANVSLRMTNRIVLSPMFGELIITALCGVSNMTFMDPPSCPTCHGASKKTFLDHDTLKRRFATVIIKGEKVKLSVSVKRYMCKQCGRVVFARSPFYPNTRLGSPVVDLAMSLASRYSFYQTYQIMEILNISISRSAIRALAQNREWNITTVSLSGLLLPVSLLSLGTLMSTSHSDLTSEDVLVACGFSTCGI